MSRSVYRHSPTRLWLARHRWLTRAAAAVTLAGLAGGVAWAVAGPRRAPPRGPGTTTAARGAHAFSVASTTPVAGAHVDSDTALAVRLTEALAPNSPMPTLSPPVEGSWISQDHDTLVFDATAPFVPGTAETLTVPGGPTGMRDAAGKTLAQSATVTFSVRSSTLRLQQLLATLGYLPVSFTPSGGPPPAKEAAAAQPGSFAWRWPDPLSGLEDHWAAGDMGVMTMGAIMTFEDQHGLAVDGLAGPRMWTALLQAAGTGASDPKPYAYVFVDKTLPEKLTLYVDGTAKYANIAVNTGIHGVDTPDGTYPVFEHVTASEMKGTNIDGTTYDDPNVPWASYFFHGDALHGFVRADYGYPQSNGCVEMSISDAGTLWPYTPIGTLVTVVGPAS